MATKRTTLVIDEEQFKILKSIIALEGISISAWLRKIIDEKIKSSKK